jgi:hypothetical protein
MVILGEELTFLFHVNNDGYQDDAKRVRES